MSTFSKRTIAQRKPKTSKPRTSDQLGTVEKTVRNLKKIAKFQEDHPKLFKAGAIGLLGIGFIAMLRKNNS